jgi:hypothetical protein
MSKNEKLTVGITCIHCKKTVKEDVAIPKMMYPKHVAKKHGFKHIANGRDGKWKCADCAAAGH